MGRPDVSGLYSLPPNGGLPACLGAALVNYGSPKSQCTWNCITVGTVFVPSVEVNLYAESSGWREEAIFDLAYHCNS